MKELLKQVRALSNKQKRLFVERLLEDLSQSKVEEEDARIIDEALDEHQKSGGKTYDAASAIKALREKHAP